MCAPLSVPRVRISISPPDYTAASSMSRAREFYPLDSGAIPEPHYIYAAILETYD